MAGKGEGKPAAKVGDVCFHAGVIITGSPDTTTLDQPSARIGDQHTCVTHPPGSPGLPPGPIVTASLTVFINRLRAARHTDLLVCGAPGPAPPGAAAPQTSSYQVRAADSYERLMRPEHEIADRDRVRDVAEPERGEFGEADDPLGVPPAPPPRPAARPPSAGAVPFEDGSPKNPYGAEGARVRAAARPGDVPSAAPTADEAQATAPSPTPAPPAAPAQATQESAEQRPPTLAIDLGYSMDLSVGGRAASSAGASGPDHILEIPHSVFIG